jgi:hypothetical protein
MNWDPTLDIPILITSIEWDSISWMTSNFELEIRTRSMDNEREHKLFCGNFGGHWSNKHRKFFCILEECTISEAEYKGIE